MSDYKFSKKEQTEAFHKITQPYMEALIGILGCDPEYKAFNHFKTTMHGENGERYVLIIQHVDGPVIEFNKASQNV